METQKKFRKVRVAAAAVAATAFVASSLSGCATEMAAQNSTAATTHMQMQNSCKGTAYEPVQPAPHARHHHGHHHDAHHHGHHHDAHHHGHHHDANHAAHPHHAPKASDAAQEAGHKAAVAAPKKHRGNQCSGVASQ